MVNLNTQKLNLNLKPTVNCKNCSYMCVSLCTTVVHNTAQNSSDNFPSYLPDNHHISNDVYWKGGGVTETQQIACNWIVLSIALTCNRIYTIQSTIHACWPMRSVKVKYTMSKLVLFIVITNHCRRPSRAARPAEQPQSASEETRVSEDTCQRSSVGQNGRRVVGEYGRGRYSGLALHEAWHTHTHRYICTLMHTRTPWKIGHSNKNREPVTALQYQDLLCLNNSINHFMVTMHVNLC